MQLPPHEVLESWPKPNYENPETRGNELLIITVLLFPLALGMVGLRLFTRLRITKSFGADDIVLLASIPPTTAIAVLTIMSVHYWGWDRHSWDVKPKIISQGLQVVIAAQCLFAVAVGCYKVSLLLLTRRILAQGTGVLRYIATAGIALVAVESFIFNIVVVFTCNPVSDYWKLSKTPQNCINEKIHLLIAGIINTSTDLLIFLLPIPTVLKLKVPFRQQVVLVGLFAAGFVVCLAGIVRIYYTWVATSTYDRTWASYGVWISSLIELYVGIVCAALPATKPFFSRYVPKLLGSSNNIPTSPSQNVRTIGGSAQQARPPNSSQPQFFSFQERDKYELKSLDTITVKTKTPSPVSQSDSRDGRASWTPRSKFAPSAKSGERASVKTDGGSSTDDLMV